MKESKEVKNIKDEVKTKVKDFLRHYEKKDYNDRSRMFKDINKAFDEAKEWLEKRSHHLHKLMGKEKKDDFLQYMKEAELLQRSGIFFTKEAFNDYFDMVKVVLDVKDRLELKS